MIAAEVSRKPAKKKPRDHSAIAGRFEDDVLSGRFPCCRLFRAAIERQRRDLASPPSGYAFRPDLGDRACRFMDMLPCAEGTNRGEPIAWQPWQVWLFRTFFGWVDGVGHPRFRSMSAWLPKGNGKSPMAAAIALYIEATAKGGEKSYSAATTAKQARAVWSHAQEMLRLAPKLRERFGLEPGEHAIKGVGDNRCYEPVSAEAGSIEGIRPEGVVILDEIHVLPNRKLYDNLRSAVAKCFTGRLVTISTAGFDMSPGALARDLYCRARDILLGTLKDETTLALIAEADAKRKDGKPTDPFSEEAIREANPNLDVSVSLAGILSEAAAARAQPSDRPSYEVKHLGWWQQSAEHFIQPEAWNALADPDMKIEDLGPEWTLVKGVDLARTRDLTAAPSLFVKVRPDGKREYRAFTRRVYLAERSPTLKHLPAEHRQWVSDGWLVLLPGDTTGYGQVKEDIAEDCLDRPGSEVCFDDWCAAEMEEDLQSRGLTCVSIRQGAKTQSEPMREFEAAVLDGRLKHDGSPVTAMCVGNLIARMDRNGNIAPDRENEYKKIDVAVGLINAMVRAMVIDPPPDLSAGFTWI